MSSETSEVGSLLWSMAQEKILTIDNLVRRGMVMVNWWCVVCKNSDDNVDHFATALLSSSYGFMEFYICSFWSEVGDA